MGYPVFEIPDPDYTPAVMSIELHHLGHFGNNLFSYALARILAENLGHRLITLPPLDEGSWSEIERQSRILDRLADHLDCFVDTPMELPGQVIEGPQIRYVLGEKHQWQGQRINLDHLLAEGARHRIVLRGYFQRTEYYHPWKEDILKWYQLKPTGKKLKIGPRDMVIHVRRSLDMRILDRRISPQFYRDAIAESDPDRVFVCGLGIDDTLRAVLRPFNPQYLDLDALDTFRFIHQCPIIAMANSTFSWWAAYLSEAERIYLPVPIHGMWSPESDIDLRVPEERYQIVDQVPLEPWRPLQRRTGSTLQRIDQNRIVVTRTGHSPITIPAPM